MHVHTPPMGWNSWNTFAENISEELILSTADRLIADGYAACGYRYVVIDDCWSLRDRDENGRLVADPVKFPHGIRYLADRIHEKGLLFGMYSCCGTLTCAGYPGSFGHETTDAATFAAWGVDFLKYDFCYRSKDVPPELLYRRMGLALANCGRDILFSACSWGSDHTEQWIKSTGAAMWRSTGDIFDTWSSVKDLMQKQPPLFATNGQGCFNDMDMLIVGMGGKGNVGMGGCTPVEYRTHFAAWCLFGSPLIIGCDIREVDETSRRLLTDPDLIALDQDPAYRQVFALTSLDYNPDTPIFARYLDNGDIALGLFNLSDSPVRLKLLTDEAGLDAAANRTATLFNLFTKETVSAGFTSWDAPVIYFNDTVFANLAPHDCALLRLRVNG